MADGRRPALPIALNRRIGGLPVSALDAQSLRRVERSGRCGWRRLRRLSSLVSVCGRSRGSRDARPARCVLAPSGFRFSRRKERPSHSSFDVPFALSPDGRRIVYVAVGDDGTRHLWLRSLDSEQQRPLAGTEGANSPFWSPDSEWVAFFAAGSLKKVRVTSPIAQVIATRRTGQWAGRHGAATTSSCSLARAACTACRRTADRSHGSDATRTFICGRSSWLMASTISIHHSHRVAPAGLAGRRAAAHVDDVSRQRLGAGIRVRVVLFVQDGVLFARPFDERRGEFAGEARRILDGIPVTGPGRAPFSVSAAGVLAFWTNAFGPPAF